jgi:RNA polymerase sigma factor (sigma-70 family)
MVAVIVTLSGYLGALGTLAECNNPRVSRAPPEGKKFFVTFTCLRDIQGRSTPSNILPAGSHMSPLVVTNQDHVETSHGELIAGARRGAPAALASLYALYGGSLLRLATRITGSPADGEDLLHDLFVGLPELLSRYEHRERLDAWLRGVIIRMALARVRVSGVRVRVIETAAHTSQIAELTDPWNAIDIERAIASLTQEARAVFVLRLIEGYSHAEIAALLGLTNGAVRVRYLRALRQLRTLLEPPL